MKIAKRAGHYRITWEDVLEAHDRVISQKGAPGVLSDAAVKSAIGRPYTGYYRTISRKAAALMQSLSGNHGFADGNKRTTLHMVSLLVRKSGYRYADLTDAELNIALEHMVRAGASGELDFEDTVAWFRRHLRKEPSRH